EASGSVQCVLSRHSTQVFSREQRSLTWQMPAFLSLQATHSSSTHTGVSPSQASHGSKMVPPLPLVSPSPSPEVVAPPPSPASTPPLPVSPPPSPLLSPAP